MAAEPGNALGQIFDILTTGSPLKTKAARDVAKAVSGFLVTTGEPAAVGFGAALDVLVRAFEARARKKGKRSK